MTALIIIGAVIILILALLLSVAKAEVKSSGELSLRAGIGPLMIRIIPKRKKRVRLSRFSQKKYLKIKEKEKKREEKKKKKAEKKEDEKEEPREKGKKPFSEKFDEIKELISAIVGATGKYSKKLIVTVNDLKISVGADEASDVAVRYGAISQSLAYLLEFLSMKTSFRAKEGAVDVTADFISGKFAVSADIVIGIRVIDALRAALYVLGRKIKKKQ